MEPYASLSYAFITAKAAFPKWRGLLYLAASSDSVPPKERANFRRSGQSLVNAIRIAHDISSMSWG